MIDQDIAQINMYLERCNQKRFEMEEARQLHLKRMAYNTGKAYEQKKIEYREACVTFHQVMQSIWKD